MPYAPTVNNNEDESSINEEAYQEKDDNICDRFIRPLVEGDDMELLNQVDIEGETLPLEVAK